MHHNPYAAIAAELAQTPFGAIEYVERTASTNADAADVLGDERFAGRSFVAEYQTLGTGRKGRTWLARPGTSLLVTTVLPQAVEARHLWAIPFWTALAAVQALAERGVATTPHWPNDLLLGERKLCGILCVSRVLGERAWVGCGVGMNVHRTPSADAEIEPPPAFCDDVAAVERGPLLHSLLARYVALLPLLASPDDIARRWEAAGGLPGARYRIAPDSGEPPFEATALRVADGGGLVVERDDGTTTTVALADARALR